MSSIDSEIQELTSNYLWKHIQSKDNPADYLSSGVNLSNQKNSNLWLYDPEWVSTSRSNWRKEKKCIQLNHPETRSTNQIILVATITKQN